MTISAAQVKELRERTGVGMMECKKALLESGGDIEAAIVAMREAGITKAAKKAGRIAAEGRVEIQIASDGRSGIIIEVNCETDFVARDSHFIEFTQAIAVSALTHGILEVEKLSQAPLSAGHPQTVEEVRQALVSKLGENIQIRRIQSLQAEGIVSGYVHSGRIGALVALSQPNAELGKDIAMHVAAAHPLALSEQQVDPAVIAKEKEIFMAQTKDSGKPPAIVEKMVIGRIHKFLSEITLLGQPFVKNPDLSITQLLRSANNNEITGFVRFEVGEGIEKVVEDFAEAVKAQAAGER